MFFFPETWHLFKGFSLWLCPTVNTARALRCFSWGLHCGLPHPLKQVHPPRPAMRVRPKTNQHNIPGLTAHTIAGRALCALWWARPTITQEDERTAARTEKKIKENTRGEKESGKEGRDNESRGTLWALYMMKTTNIILTIIGKVGAVLKDYNRRKLRQSHRLVKIQNIFTLLLYVHLEKYGTRLSAVGHWSKL